MDIIFTAVRNIIIYLILVTVIMNLMGSSSFKKYIGLFTGMVLIIIVILPIMDLFHISDKMTYYLDVNNFIVKADDISSQLFEAGNKQNEAVISNYKDSLKEEISTRLSIHGVTLNQIDIVIEEDPDSVECGKVRSLDIIGSETGQEVNRETTKSKIDEVIINKITINEKKLNKQDQEGSEKDNLDSLLELNIKQELARFFNLELECISIEISK